MEEEIREQDYKAQEGLIQSEAVESRETRNMRTVRNIREEIQYQDKDIENLC